MPAQLPLGLKLSDSATFANFYEGQNQQVVDALQNTLSGAGESYLFLWGSEAGVGRSHLLQACCHLATKHHQAAAYLAFADEPLTPAVLDGLDEFDLVCLDDIQDVLGDADWEEALFHFYNRLRQAGNVLLVSADAVPRQLSVNLPDLHSRLTNGLVLELTRLNDEQIIAALQMRAYNRGIYLSDDVGQFLLRRFPRNMQSLFGVLDQLDQASMISKKRITIPFIKQVLTDS